MNDIGITQLLSKLSDSGNGWNALVPFEFGQFLGHPVLLELQTRSSVASDPSPLPDHSRLALARQILTSLPQVLADAERAYVAFAEEDGSDLADVVEPRFWLFLQEYEDDGPGRWAFVVGRRNWPDFGVHVEFDGLEILEVWAGD